eukprot:scaffold112196_cov66-Phaeocystis_antarctica.AAC.1
MSTTEAELHALAACAIELIHIVGVAEKPAGGARCHGPGMDELAGCRDRHGGQTGRMGALDRLLSGLGGRQGCGLRPEGVDG